MKTSSWVRVFVVWCVWIMTMAAGAGAARAGEEIKRADVEGFFRVKTIASKHKVDWLAQFDELQLSQGKGVQASYPAELVLGFVPITYRPTPEPTVGSVVKQAVWPPRVRATHDDVVKGEDPTVVKPKKNADNFEGALVQYSRDGVGNSDTWLVKGAVIAPFIVNNELRPGLRPDYWGIVPSVFLHRVSTSGNPRDEVDQLTYRAGLFFSWINATSRVLGARDSALHLRGYGTWSTDTSHKTEVPAGEFDLEPHFRWDNGVALGYRMKLLGKKPGLNEDGETDQYDDVLVGMRVRLWGHAEYGSVLNTGGQTGLVAQDFFRLGGSARVQFDPFFHPRLKLSSGFDWRPDLEGTSETDTRFTAGLEWLLVESEDKARRLNLRADYYRGFEDLTHRDLDTFKVGLGITF